MQNCGIDVTNEKGTIYSYYISLIVISLLLSLLASTLTYMSKNQNEYKLLAYSSALSFEIINIGATYLYFLATKKSIRILLQNLDANIFVYTNEEQIAPTYPSLLKENNMALLFVIAQAYLIVSTIVVFSIPFFALCLTNDQRLKLEIIPIWLPIDNEVAIYLFQVFTSLAVIGVLYAKWIFFSYLLFEYERQCRRLCSALKTLEGRSVMETQQRIQRQLKSSSVRRTANVHFKNVYSKVIHENLIQCIQHHQSLVE